MDARELADSMRAGCLGVRVLRLHRVVTRVYEQHLGPLGLTGPQLEILSCLVLMGPVRPSVLASELRLERSTLSRNLGLLHTKGWVEPAGTSATGRTMAVQITTGGTTVLESAADAWQAASSETARLLGPDAVGILDGWLAPGVPGAPVSEVARGARPA